MGTRLKRRAFFGLSLALVAGAPAARILYLKTQDELMDPVQDPDVVFVNGWVLDASDRTATEKR